MWNPIRPAIARGAMPVALFLAFGALPAGAGAATLEESRVAMGTRFDITAVHPDAASGKAAIEAAWAEIERVEELISEWRPSSKVSEINRNAGVAPVAVPKELFRLIRRSLRVSQLTDGAFDITFHSVGRLWNFKSRNAPIPSEEAIREALEDTGFRHVILDEAKGTVFLDRPGTRIGFGGIGQGYGANRAVFVLKEHGVTGGIVNGSGDLVLFGTQEGGAKWRVGIGNPLDPGKAFAWIDVTEQAVVTSGDYENFIEKDGKRYGHTIDPRTGWPADGIRSATVVCPDGELADALATGLTVLGLEKGLALINRLEGIEALLVDAKGDIHLSDGLEAMITKAGEKE
jgi:thiamine biosynthesis lipoprotein